MVTKKATPIFANKEDGNFREALKLYDSKQYKKSLKLVDANLKKNSNHAESLALKGCILFHTGHKNEAEIYIKKSITKGASNYLVNHLVGLYYRALEDYVEAAKWLKAANDNGSPNKPILRDLSFMQAQNRDYKHLVESRQLYLEHAPGFRANWTGLAVAQHLNKDYNGAVGTLSKIEDIIKEHLTENDMYEHSECLLYKNQIIAEAGNITKALEVLENDKEGIKDKLSYLEYKAKYLLLLGEKKEASKVYRQLLKRNPDNKDFYTLLEVALETSNKSPEVRLKLYEKLQSFYPKSDPPKFIPLTFLPSESDLFENKCRDYIVPQLLRGVPATFVNIKPIYQDKKKLKVIENIVLNFLHDEAFEIKNPTVTVWTYFFLAQHYLYTNDLETASKYIDLALDHSPTLVELYIIKARILKHLGKLREASNVMTQGRELDLQDRFINSKATKYLLRDNRVDEAIDCISLFTKLEEGVINGCKDLHIMQVNWVLIESAEAYARIYHELIQKFEESNYDKDSEEYELGIEEIEINKGLAIKRFQAILKTFKIYFNDQYDFHSYCLRRGTPRDYIDTIKWEDKIKSSPVYIRALKGITELYFELYGEQQSLKVESKENDFKIKKSGKKQKKVKGQNNKKKLEQQAKVESEKDDKDPFGIKLLHDLQESDIIEQLFELYEDMKDQAPKSKLVWENFFKIYSAQGKYVLALQAIKSLDKILNSDGDKKLKDIGNKIITLSQTTKEDPNANQAIIKVVEKGLNSAYPDFEKLSISEFTEVYKE
ncbi:uncharacterized protein KGF55_002101 [Candida pseudojiufengensis]|uniref:uncharacterized protein n=1 Tax=Candida pseudojiufengensis TaxID=497109 RepID=UPI0022257395|nr:uncharacterized protein KGF55_002101 [Candida pseudojiufengensis]KAI5964159.1 hypothetical protein KGF55_002101 [Candida pseudojiufengensis]